MDVDLELKVGFRYSTAVLVFFISYIIFQPFATAVIRRLGPRKFISAIIFTWGAIMVVSAHLPPFYADSALTVVLLGIGLHQHMARVGRS
jgi:MFS family permease